MGWCGEEETCLGEVEWQVCAAGFVGDLEALVRFGAGAMDVDRYAGNLVVYLLLLFESYDWPQEVP